MQDVPLMAHKNRTRKTIQEKDRAFVLRRDKYVCGYCGKRKKRISLTVDHIIPVLYGGYHGIKNWVAACRSCNRVKWHFAPREKQAPRLCFFSGKRVAKVTWLAKGKRFPRRVPKISFRAYS